VNCAASTGRLISIAFVLLIVGALGLNAAIADRGDAGATFAAWAHPTPALSLKDSRGVAHTLNEFRGRVVLVHFWATWCEPCREELPAISAITRRYAAQGLSLVAVDVGESRAGIARFIDEVPIEGLVLEDRDSEVFKRWRAQVLPASYLVDRDGRVRVWHLGELDWRDPKTLHAVETLLGPRKTGGRQQESNLPGSG
jgi:thiol-disulfide isomerase/thioredoxin